MSGAQPIVVALASRSSDADSEDTNRVWQGQQGGGRPGRESRSPGSRTLRRSDGPRHPPRPTDAARTFFGTIVVGNQRETFVFVRWQFWVTTAVALLVALLAGYCMMLFGQNRATQAELAQRTQYLQQTVQLDGLYRELVKALADLAVRNKDQALTDLLAKQGITFNTATPAVPESNSGARP